MTAALDQLHERRRAPRGRRHAPGDALALTSAADAAPRPLIDRAIEAALVSLLIFCPLAFGVVQAWSEMIFLGLGSALALCLAIKFALRPGQPIVWSWTFLPIALFLALILLQLAPLPVGMVRCISPAADALRREALGDSASGGFATLTLYRQATWHDLRLVAMLAVIFFAVVNTGDRSGQILRLLTILAVVGAGVVLLAFAQDLTGAEAIYWIGPPAQRNANSGPFVAYNHYGQFANLVAGAALALLLTRLLKAVENREPDVDSLLHRLRDGRLRTVYWPTGVVLLAAVTVIFSQSRGAWVGAALGLLAVTAALFKAPGLPSRGWIFLPLALGAISAALCLLPDAYLSRLESLGSGDSYSDRWQIVKDLSHAWRQFPIVGVGLGGHEFIYPMYDRSTNLATATHAENEYAQLLEETGVVGLSIALAFLVMVIHHAVRAARRDSSRLRLVPIGLGFSMVAILAQSFVDFGQHLPGVAVYTCVISALLVKLGRRSGTRGRPLMTESSSGGDVAVRPPNRLSKPARLAAIAVVILLAAGVLLAADRARRAEAHFLAASRLEQGLAQNNWEDSNQAFATLLQHASAAAELQPLDVRYRYSLNLYRWRAISRVRDSAGDVMLTPTQRGYAQRIADDLRLTRALCPTYGPVDVLLGQLDGTILHDGRADGEIAAAYRFSQNSLEAAWLAGRQDARLGRVDAAIPKLRRYLDLAGRFDAVARLLCFEIHRPDLALLLAQGDCDRLTSLCDVIAGDPTLAPTRQAAKKARFALLRAMCDGDNPPPRSLQMLGEEAMERGDYQTAVDCYRKALVSDYGNVEIHLALVNSLVKLGRLNDALSESHVILRIQPQMPQAMQWIKELRSQIGGDAD